MVRIFVFWLCGCALMAQQPKLSGPQAEVVSLLGKTFYAEADETGDIRKADAALAKAPQNVSLLIAAGRARDQRLQFNSAIEMYTRAIAAAVDDPRGYRFRGHRYITIRRFDDAVRDLSVGSKLAPSSYDIAYHLGMALYLRGEFQRAANEYARCMNQTTAGDPLPTGWRTCASVANDDDARASMTDWRYRALRRAGQHDEARRLLDTITENMKVKESATYYQALLYYKGMRRVSDLVEPSRASGNAFATIAYALGNHLVLAGRPDQACAQFRKIVEGETWNAFGFIAAEVELSRATGPCGAK